MSMANSKAQAFKEKGNAAFKSGDYPTAIGHYTSAILADTDRKDVTFPLNRAAAYLKLGKYADTERDCNTVLSISGSKPNVKALFRRGQARVGLGKLLEARQDFTDVLSQEPSNTSASDELKNVTNLIQKEKAKKSKAPPSSVASPTITTTTTTTTTTEGKRRRVPIRIVGDTKKPPVADGGSASKPTPSPSPASTTRSPSSAPPEIEKNSSSASTKSTTTLNSPTDSLQAISSRSLKPSSPAPAPLYSERMDADTSSTPASASASPSPSASSAPQPKSDTIPSISTKPKQESFKEAKQARDAKSPRVGGGIFRLSGQNTIFASRGGSASDAAAASPVAAPSEPSGPVPIPANDTPSPSPPPPPPPKTFFDFTRTWDALKTPWERWTFLNTIPPTDFPDLCKTSLDPGMLTFILAIFLAVLTQDDDDDDDSSLHSPPDPPEVVKAKVRAYMDHFVDIPRFATLIRMMSRSEKEVAMTVWRALGVDEDSLQGVWRFVGH